MKSDSRKWTIQRIAAVTSAVVLAGTLIWYRAHRASAEQAVLSGTKSMRIATSDPGQPPATTRARPEAHPTTVGAGFKVNNDVGPEFMVAPASKSGAIFTPRDLRPATGGPGTRPVEVVPAEAVPAEAMAVEVVPAEAMAAQRRMFYGSKSAAVIEPRDLLPTTAPAATTAQTAPAATPPATSPSTQTFLKP